MTQTKTLILIFASLMLMCVPTNAFTPAQVTQIYYVSDYGVDTGIGTGISYLDAVDGIPDNFTEAKSLNTAAQESFPYLAEDDTDKWALCGDFHSLTTDLNAYVGTYSIEATLASSGTGCLQYHNGTAFAWNIDAGNCHRINLTARADVGGKVYLSQIRTHKTAGDYGYINSKIYLTTTWQEVEYSSADVSYVGDVEIGDPVNWMEFEFINEQPVAREVFMDTGMLYSPAVGDPLRKFGGWFNFTSLGHYDNYAVNITAWRVDDGASTEADFTEDAADWTANSSVITISANASQAQWGTYAIQFDYDGTADANFFWDNATTKAANLDITDYRVLYFTLWGNRTFSVSSLKVCTDASNYFHIDLAANYSTTPTERYIPFSAMQQTGTPDKGNIDWMEVGITTTDVDGPTRIFIDHAFMNSYGAFRFKKEGKYSSEFRHAHDYISDSVVLDAVQVRADGFVFVELNDTLFADDAFNTTLMLDALFITAWNVGGGGGGAAPITPVIIPTTPEVTPEAWVIPAQYYWLIGLGAAGIIGVVVVAKVGMYRLDDTFGGGLGYISDSLMDAYDKLREVFG